MVIEYVELKKDAFFSQVSVTDEEMKAAYESEIANLAEQRDAAHILIEVGGDVSDEQAKAKIEDIQKRLQKGEDFAALAKEFSQDPGSASDGGDLGYAGKGVYDPAFEDALYALKKDEVSAPVRTEFGWHLIKLLGVQAPEVPTFASMKAKLETDLKAQRVEQRFVEATKQLEDAAFESSDLAQPAQELGLKVQTSEPFGRQGGQGIASNRQVLQAAFSQEVMEDGSNSGAIELDPNTLVVIRVKEHRKPQQLELDQVADSIRAQLTKTRASEAAKAAGEQLVSELRDGKAKPEGAEWQVVEAATRNQDGVDPAVLQALFRMPKPSGEKSEFSGIALANGDYAVIRLKGVSEPEQALSDEEKAMYRRFLASRSGQEDFAAYRKQLESKADIERF